MKTFSQILSYLLPFLYLGGIYFYYLIYQGRNKSIIHKSTWVLAGLLAIHAVEIATRHIALKTIPLSSVHDAFSFMAFSVLLVYMIIELSIKNKGSGIFILSFAFIFELISTFSIDWKPETNELLQQTSFAIHASVSIMGYSALALSALYGLMYIIQNKNIKERKLGKLFNQLPALTYLEKMSMRSVTIGIILLGIGILQGHIQALKIIGTFWPNDLKVILTDVIWIFYVMVFVLAKATRWRGIYVAYFFIYGFLTLILTVSIVVYFADSFHSFY
ncbi:MAG: cytochrome C assembly family protein [Candidatus Cyclobacteriaceae bacterium M3_2C_046]